MLLGLLALAPTAFATDVLIVEATPATLDDFSVASMVYDMVVAAARDEGLDLDDADAIRKWAGKDADACWDNDACPANLWARTDARLAVVMDVGHQGEGLDIGVRLHGADDAAPFKVIREQVGPGGEEAFAKKVARAMKDALPLLPRRKPVAGPVLVLEDENVPAPHDLHPVVHPDPPVPDDDDDGPPARDTARRADTRPSTTRDDESRPDETGPVDRRPPDHTAVPPLRADEERRRMGIPAGAYARYQASGLSREAWLAGARVRAGHAFLEIAGGYALGDVDRGYGVRLRIEEAEPVFDTVGTSSWEGAGRGSSPTFGFTLGYAPAWFLDTSVNVSVVYGYKHLDTGWECLDQCDPPASEYVHDPVRAVQALVEPRLRLYPVATGVVKPYALVAFSMLLHDGYQVPDPAFVDYPDSPGGASFGPTVGLGVAVDPIARLSLFAEVPATLLVAPGAHIVHDGDVTLAPETLDSAGYLVRFVGGIGVRL